MGPIPTPDASAGILDSERRRIFYESVGLEDQGHDWKEIATLISAKYDVSAEAVAEIRREGFPRGWPILATP